MLTVVAGVILNKDQEIFIAKRPLHKSQGGLWEFPGGKVELGETHQTSLRRELIEELTIEVEIGNFIASNKHTYDDFCIDIHAYFATILKGNLQLNEHLEQCWVQVENLLDYSLAPADIPLAEKVISILSKD